MTDEQIRLYAIARCVVPAGTRIRTISEPASGGTLYTLELESRGGRRWFAVHSNVLVPGLAPVLSDSALAAEIKSAIAKPPALRR